MLILRTAAQALSKLLHKTPPRFLGLLGARPVPIRNPKPHSNSIRGVLMLYLISLARLTK